MVINRSIVIITDDPVAASMLSSRFARPERYVTVLESPRMNRPDADNEIARSLNVINRIRPSVILYFGSDARVSREIIRAIPAPLLSFHKIDELARFGIDVDEWSGLTPEEAVQKLYRANFYAGSPTKAILYNGTADIDYVVAANYAILHQAKLLRLETPDELLPQTVDDLNKIDADPPSVREIDIRALTEKLAEYIPRELIETEYEKILIITEGIPFGLAIEDRDVLYANNLILGQFLVHNIYEYEWGKNERIGPIGLFIADRTVALPGEYENFTEALKRARGLTRQHTTGHPKLAELHMMSIPYDILYLATHGKQLDGTEEEYEFTDSQGITHNVVIEKAEGVIGLVAYIKSIDGAPNGSSEWDDAHRKIWGEFAQRHMYEREPLPPPVHVKAGIKLPMRSLVLGNEPGMNSPFSAQRLASNQRPIVIANACGSWTDMSTRFMFGGASAYIGTLWAVNSGVSNTFAAKLHEKLFSKPLDEAFFEAKSSLPTIMDKKNYVMTGSFENKYDADTSFTSNGYAEVKQRLERLLVMTRERIKAFNKDTPKDIKNNTEIDEVLYEEELKELDAAEKLSRKSKESK